MKESKWTNLLREVFIILNLLPFPPHSHLVQINLLHSRLPGQSIDLRGASVHGNVCEGWMMSGRRRRRRIGGNARCGRRGEEGGGGSVKRGSTCTEKGRGKGRKERGGGQIRLPTRTTKTLNKILIFNIYSIFGACLSTTSFTIMAVRMKNPTLHS